MKVAIIGAGMAGLCMGIELRRAGIDFVILEKSPRLGGTWWENTYPGCACDIPSHLYAFSFAPKPDWSRVYPGQAEILAYLERLAADHGLLAHIRFGAAVRAARYEEAACRWRVELGGGEVLEADALVLGTGGLHVPRYPDIPGRGSFAGPSMHSARWDHGVDLRGKRIGVIGNAASAVQIVPEIAAAAEQLHVFQRSAHWVIPRADRAYSRPARWLLGARPLQRLYRWAIWSRLELIYLLVFRKGSWAARRAERAVRSRIEREISDPAVRAALVPDYPIGCKRVLISDDYYRALERANVRLVTDRLVEETPTGLATSAERFALDVIVYATGFDAFTLGGLTVRGRAGEDLSAHWTRSPRAHLGITVPGFPNLYVLVGPNTGLSHNSISWMIECQVGYAVRCLRLQRRLRVRELEVRQTALDACYERIARRFRNKIYGECRSWYRRDGDGVNFAIWPATTARYWWETRRPDPADFRAMV